MRVPDRGSEGSEERRKITITEGGERFAHKLSLYSLCSYTHANLV